jgi:AmmeMemoRadiSam system protein B
MNRQIDALLSAARGDPAVVAEAERAQGREPRAVMLPHAGWRFCGEVIAQVLARIDVPDRVVVIGPKHTPYGPSLSVPPHSFWDLPGFDVPIDAELAERFEREIPEMQREEEAHRLEHGTEVLLPFLRRLNPDVKVLPMTVGRLDYDALEPIAQSLHRLMREAEEAGERVLLVISSDMNHFAPEGEGRRRDKLALEAMIHHGPQALHDVCLQNHISMCGMLPAVAVMRALQKTDRPMVPRQVAYTTSAQVSGDDTSVVGYAGVIIE